MLKEREGKRTYSSHEQPKADADFADIVNAEGCLGGAPDTSRSLELGQSVVENDTN